MLAITVVVAFVLFLIIRLLFVAKYQQKVPGTMRTALKDQLAAWLLVAAILLGISFVVLVFGLWFGPIPPVHEWGGS